MKIIINERQLRTIIESEKKISDKKFKAYKETIDELGIYDAARILDKTIIELYELGLFEIEELRKSLLELVNQYGFYDSAESQGMSKLKLAKMVDLPIKSHGIDDNEIFVRQLLKELVEIDDVYNECDLIYDSFSRTINWSCRFDDGNQIINTLTYATPYFNEDDTGRTPVETDEFEVIKDDEKEEYGTMSGIYFNTIHSPSEFKNVDKLIHWFENDYKLGVYKAIKTHLKDFKERYT
jgi:hypothetical protein